MYEGGGSNIEGSDDCVEDEEEEASDHEGEVIVRDAAGNKTLKYSIISDEDQLIRDQEVYRQLRYLKSNSSLKDSLISMLISSSIMIPDELSSPNTQSKDVKAQVKMQNLPINLKEPDIKPFSL